MAATTVRRDHIAGMDALRALAFVMVYGFHAWQNAGSPLMEVNLGPLGSCAIGLILWRGEMGTTLFFILSGFLLSLPYWRQGGEPLPRFMARRLLRIFPAYALAILVYVLSFRLWGYDLWLGQIVSHVLLIHNLFEFSVFGITPPLWYVATQAQLYLAVPLFFGLLRRLARNEAARTVGAVLFWCLCGLVAAPGALLLQRFVAATQPDPRLLLADGLVWHTSAAVHVAEFATGIAMSRIYVLLQDRQRRWWHWGVPLAMLVLALYWPEHRVMPKSFWPARPLALGSTVLAVSMLEQQHPLARLLSWRPVRWLGTISYGAYLYHGMTLTLVFHVNREMLDRLPFMRYTASRGALAFGAALALGAISYYALERPVLRWSAQRRRSAAGEPARTDA